jgi:hypothetical protein
VPSYAYTGRVRKYSGKCSLVLKQVEFAGLVAPNHEIKEGGDN